jgi:hypothetical protein
LGNSDSPLTEKSPEMVIGNSLSVRLVLCEADAVGVGGRSLGVLGLLGDQLDASVAALGNSDGL